MKARFWVILFATPYLLSGCASIDLNEMIVTTSEVESVRGTVSIDKGNLKGSKSPEYHDQFEVFYSNLTDKLNANDAPTRANSAVDNAYSNSTTNQLVRSEVVQGVVERVHSALTSQTPSDIDISIAELNNFGRLLSANKGELLKELTNDTAGVRRLYVEAATKSGSNRDFSHVLLEYFKAYGSGKFVDRFGNNISKPSLSTSGITDDDIQGLATVFFEAMFDCWFADVPIFYSVKSTENIIYLPPPNPAYDAGKTEDVTVAYERTYVPAYITNGGEVPSAVTVGFAMVNRVDLDKVDITEKEAKWIQQISTISGKQSRSLIGLGLGFLSNINFSVVIGADFAIGDNNTLMHLAQTITEISSRRMAEYATWKVLSSN
jgi:hypothetical protein